MISIIIPVFNASRYISRCLDSLLMQTIAGWEAILVNDGSTDDSREICDQYAQKDPRFNIITKENSGVSSARNTGLEEAHGEWVTFVDADDFLPEYALELLLNKAADVGPDLVFAGYEVYDDHLIKTYKINEKTDELLDRDSTISLLFKPRYYRYLGYVWGKMYKTDIIRDHHIQFSPDIVFNEDRLFLTEYLSHCNQILFTTEPVYCYYEHSASAMASLEQGFNKMFITDLDAMIRMKECIASCSPSNIGYAAEGVAASYWRIRKMMFRFHSGTRKHILELHRKLRRSLSIKEYCQLIIRPYFPILLQSIRRRIQKN